MRERGDSGALALNEGRPKPCWKWQKSRLHDHTEFKVSDRMEHALNFSRKQRGRRSGQRSERDVGDEGGGEERQAAAPAGEPGARPHGARPARLRRAHGHFKGPCRWHAEHCEGLRNSGAGPGQTRSY